MHSFTIVKSVKVFIPILFMFLFVSVPADAAHAPSHRLEQLVKSERAQRVVDNVVGARQSIACSDISGHIESVTLSVAMAPAGYSNTLYTKFTGGIGQDRISDTVTLGPADNYQQDVTFTFNPPVDVDSDLCANGGSPKLDVYATSPYGVWLFGSSASTYSGGTLNGFVRTDLSTIPGALFYLADAYFIINGQVQNNAAPGLTTIGNQTTNESQPLTFTVSATDPDDDTITYSATNLPVGGTLNPTTGEFTWTPGYTDAGTYEITFTATEDTPEALSDSETVTITVNNSNRAPELTPIGNQLINEGDTLQFTVSVTDTDSDTVTLSANNLPTGATFTPSTGLFYWNTDFDDAGNYPDIEFTATDNGIPMELDVELITITVGDVNRMPEVTNPGPQEVLEEDTLSFNVSATDPDGDIIKLSASNLPNGASFNPTTGTFTWTPSLSDAGVYTVTITATDNGLPVESASTEVVITVGDNPTPIEQAEDLVEEVITIDIPQNVENSYLANLQKVGQFILEGKITAAINQLNAFVVKITKDYQKGILTQTQYQSLLTAANDLIDDLTSG